MNLGAKRVLRSTYVCTLVSVAALAACGGSDPKPKTAQQAPPGYPQQGYPQQGYPQQGYPQQGAPPQGYPQQGAPQAGYPPQGAPPQGTPPQGAPAPTAPAGWVVPIPGGSSFTIPSAFPPGAVPTAWPGAMPTAWPTAAPAPTTPAAPACPGAVPPPSQGSLYCPYLANGQCFNDRAAACSCAGCPEARCTTAGTTARSPKCQ